MTVTTFSASFFLFAGLSVMAGCSSAAAPSSVAETAAAATVGDSTAGDSTALTCVPYRRCSLTSDGDLQLCVGRVSLRFTADGHAELKVEKSSPVGRPEQLEQFAWTSDGRVDATGPTLSASWGGGEHQLAAEKQAEGGYEGDLTIDESFDFRVRCSPERNP